MQWLVRILALAAVSCGVPGPVLAAGWEAGAAYRVGLGSGTVQAELLGLQLVVLSVEMGEEEGKRVLWVRVGYRNMGQTVRSGKVKVPTEPVRLGVARTGQELAAVEVEERLVEPEWKAGLRPQTMWAGTLKFELSAEDDGRWLEEVMTLRMAPFLPISFRLDEARRFEAVGWGKVMERVVGDFAMAPVLEPVAALPMRVEGIRVKDGRVWFAIVVRNGSRFPLQWSGKLSLREMRLLTEEAELLEPVEVSGVLAEGLGVVGQVWKAGEENRGEVSFKLPHAHAAATLSLLLPGYEPLGLTTDGETGQWQVVRRPEGRGGVGQTAPGVVALREEEERFESVTAFWLEQGRRLQNRDQAGYLARFGEASGARAAQARSLAGMVRVPISWIEFAVPAMQKLAGDALGVPGLVVEMRCLLAGLPRENEFVSRWKCDLRRVSEDAEWTVVSYEQEGRPSFWDLGFSELVATDHFLVFYQLAIEDGKKRAETAGQQLERARARLLRSRLPLERRYAAFVIPEKADFRALTGRDPGAFSGATSAAYAERDGVLRVMNQAMYVNDSHFSSLQRRWGKQDRLVTMQHELVHLALAPVTRPWTPVWLVEGIATHYAGQLNRFSEETLRQRLPQGRVLAHLSQQPFMGANVGDVDEVWMQYHYSAAAVRWIEREFGEGKLFELYQAFGKVKPKVWEKAVRTGDEEEMELESEAKKAIRLEMTVGEVERVLNGWHLDQVDAATRLSLQR